MNNGASLWSRLRDARIWRVLLVYGGACWAILEATAFFIEEFGLPRWFLPGAVVLLLIGIAVLVSTALVQAGATRPTRESAVEGPSGGVADASAGRGTGGLRGLLTWRNAILGGVVAFALWGVVAAGWLLLSPGPGGGGPAAAGASAGGAQKLVVLPFENLSGQEDDYFAAGITDAITARLAMLDGLGVISRQSAVQYEGSDKTAREIGAELGVGYILEGTVQRERPGDLASRVRVIPQLVRISDDTHLWAATYDEEMDEVFRVQSEIAERVARALDLTLREPERRAIEARPSDNLEAYDLYLRGKDYLNRAGLEFLDRASVTAVEFFQRAVELDPEFAQAWAALSHAHIQVFGDGYDIGPDRLEQARRAAERSLALNPDLADGHAALSRYHGARGDWELALREAERARSIKPSDADVLLGIAEYHERRGELDEALATVRRAADLDPRSVRTALALAGALEWADNYDEAVEQFDRAIELAPDLIVPYARKIEHYLLIRGDADGARSVVRAGSARMGELAFATHLLSWTYVPFRILPDQLDEPLGRMSVGSFGHDTVSHYLYHIARGWQYRLAGREPSARAYYDSAAAILESRVRDAADPVFDLRTLAEAHAGAGRTKEAIAVARRGLELAPPSEDRVDGIENLLALARVHAMVGGSEEAVARLNELAEVEPSYLGGLTIDPIWDRVRDDPRFQALSTRRE